MVKATVVFPAVLLLLCAARPSEAQSTVDGRSDCLISLWNHRRDVDPTPLVATLGFNLIWSHDPPYSGQSWEETDMYRLLRIPGVKYVFAKIERAAWGWTHDQSLRHAKWVAELSREHPPILGVYLNDFYDEIEDGHRTEAQRVCLIIPTAAWSPASTSMPARAEDVGSASRNFETCSATSSTW